MTKPTQNNIGIMSLPIPVNIALSKNALKQSIYPLGKKHFESTDWLGNVRVTYTDKKSWQQNKFALNVSSTQDYYPFGAVMEGRKYNLTAYRYAFNTQERVPELNESHYTALYWEYDGRLARRWNVDPQWQRIPEQSPYSVNNNNPIQYTDPDGEIGIIGAAIGAVVGAVVEVGSQVVSNVAQGKPAFKNIDWADVVISAGEGALVGSGVGLATVVVGQTVGAFAKAAVDFTSEDNLEVVGGDKDLGEAGIDLASNLIGNTIGRFGLGDAISKNVIRGLSKGSPGTSNIFGKLLVGEIVGELTEGVITGGISGGLMMLKSEADFRKALREGILLNEVEIVGDKKTGTYSNVDKQFKSEMEKKNPGFLKGLFVRNKKEE
ncbi:MAG: hypothetical protein KatS3mg027_2657 [Bacteroidia bacterium]|nr:MAG: hypothetical protein KatS3mg027_2657 [Bacteroidia bacterium]